MTPRIEKAIDIFLDAINNGTLAKGTCAACAVSNLVAHGMGTKIESLYEQNTKHSQWADAFCTSYNDQRISPEDFDLPGVVACVQATDFTILELAKIEYAFEQNAELHYMKYGCYSKEVVRADQIKGLAAVVDVMLTFDDCKETAQEVFTKRAELIPV